MHLILLGVNHETAPVEYREKLAFSEKECESFLCRLVIETSAAEAVMISTCNRTELYIRIQHDNGLSPDSASGYFIKRLLDWKDAVGLKSDIFYIKHNGDAVRHLFRVVSGLESMIKGEAQILAQAKLAYAISCRALSCNFLMHKLFHSAFKTGKLARTETEIGVGAVSVSLAAVELAGHIFKDLSKKKALVIGAGEMANLTAQHFCDKGIASITVANRTEENAEKLAKKLGGRAVPISRLVEAIAEADVVIASTSSPSFLITPDMMKEVMKLRRNRQVFLIDIAVPRNIDPAVRKIYNVFAHDIDNLRKIVDNNLVRRKAEIPKVERIIEKEAEAFDEWHESLEVAPTIKDLVGQIEEIRRQEIEKSARHFSEDQLEHIDALTRSLVKKILHNPIMKLRDVKSNEDGDATFWVSAVRDVFNLGKSEDD